RRRTDIPTEAALAKAYVYTAHGGPEVERLVDLPRPVPAAGELLVAVHAAGLNPVDWRRRAGFLPGPPPSFPAVFGLEVSGVIAELGPDTEGFAVGDAVFGNPVAGGYAEWARLPADMTAPKPDGLSYVDAAALPVAAGTAYDGMQQLALPA